MFRGSSVHYYSLVLLWARIHFINTVIIFIIKLILHYNSQTLFRAGLKAPFIAAATKNRWTGALPFTVLNDIRSQPIHTKQDNILISIYLNQIYVWDCQTWKQLNCCIYTELVSASFAEISHSQFADCSSQGLTVPSPRMYLNVQLCQQAAPSLAVVSRLCLTLPSYTLHTAEAKSFWEFKHSHSMLPSAGPKLQLHHWTTVYTVPVMYTFKTLCGSC